MSKKYVIAVLPTGFGKSLIYQCGEQDDRGRGTWENGMSEAGLASLTEERKHKRRSDDGEDRERTGLNFIWCFVLLCVAAVDREGLCICFILSLKCVNVRRFPPPPSHNNEPRSSILNEWVGLSHTIDCLSESPLHASSPSSLWLVFRSIQLRKEAFEGRPLVTPLWKWFVYGALPDPNSVSNWEGSGFLLTRLHFL